MHRLSGSGQGKRSDNRIVWEGDPAYQEAQVAATGVGLILLFIACVVYCLSRSDWHLLCQVLRFAGALVFCLALLSLTGRLLVKVFTRRSNCQPRSEP
jgi:hypothetical protein